MTVIKDSGLLGLVKEELEANLREIEVKLEIYADDFDKGEANLEACCHSVHQIGGVCRLVGMPAAAMLADEMEAMMKTLGKKEGAIKEACLDGCPVLCKAEPIGAPRAGWTRSILPCWRGSEDTPPLRVLWAEVEWQGFSSLFSR